MQHHHLPDRETKCHRTNFQETCFKMVTENGCRLWRHFIGHDPQTNSETDCWDCVEGMQLKFWIENARTNREIHEAVTKLTNEVVKANDSGMASALMGINAQVHRVARIQESEIARFIESETQDRNKTKLIGST